MYLIYKLHKLEYPVNQIYDTEVKPISTRRFNNEMMEKGEFTIDTNPISGGTVPLTPD